MSFKISLKKLEELLSPITHTHLFPKSDTVEEDDTDPVMNKAVVEYVEDLMEFRECTITYTDNTTEKMVVCVRKPDELIILIELDNSDYLTFNTHYGIIGDYTVYWGDGTTTDYTYTSSNYNHLHHDISHTYSETGEYTIRIRGDIDLSEEQIFEYVSMKEITIPSTVTSIGNGCFEESSVESVIIKKGVTSLEEGCFYYCSGLTEITIPNSVTSLGDGCFANCYELKNINLPLNITSLGNYLFSSCYKLEDINIPNSVTSLGNYCFYHCEKISSITLPDTVTNFGEYCFNNCHNLTNVTLSNGLVSIGEGCFDSCVALISINIPSTVTSIGKDCFDYCENLEEIILNWTTSDTILAYDSNSASYPTGNTGFKFKIPNGTTSLYTAKGYPSQYLEEVSEPSEPIMVHDYSLALSSDKDILSYYDEDTATLTATLTDNNSPVQNATVTFKKGNTVLDTVTTNNSGVATYEYESSGSGDVIIIAEYGNLTETYTIEDCLRYEADTVSRTGTHSSDYLIYYDENWNFQNNHFEMSFSMKGSNNGFGLAPSANRTPYHHLIYGFGGEPRKVKYYVGKENSGENAYYIGVNSNSDTWYDVKFVYNNGSIDLIYNDEVKETVTNVSYLNNITWYIIWGEWSTVTLYIKNLKIKPL